MNDRSDGYDLFPPNLSHGPSNLPGPGQLFVGSCYQPIDRSSQQIDSDIAIMKGAGFNVVRMGDLSWDSFKPSQGKFEFEWLDIGNSVYKESLILGPLEAELLS